MRYLILTACLLLALLTLCNAQDNPFERPISISDSIKLKRILDSLDNAPMFSLRRQRYYDSALAIKPWKAGWWQQKAMTVMKQKKYDLGMSFLDSAVKYDTKYHRYLEYRAFMKCIFQKSYREAIKDFDLMLSYNGNLSVMDHSYYFYKGLCYLQLNEPDSCVYFINLSIDDSRKKQGANMVHHLEWFYMGIAYYEQENYPAAIACFDSSLKIYTQFSDAQYYRGICLYRQGKPAEAVDDIKAAAINFNAGYTINEDNAVHEEYPYQVKKASYDGTLKYLQELNSKAGK